MADSDYIDSNFKQKAAICAIASYSTIIEYFSDNQLSIQDVLNNYAKHFKLKYFDTGNHKLQNQQQAITDHFHYYCRVDNKRGFNFINELHLNNTINTENYCTIIDSNAYQKEISDSEINKIRHELVKNDALAIVLYKVSNTFLHAIVVGYDPNLKEYFYKDPEKSKVELGDRLSEIEIWEYVIFNETEG